MRKMVREILCRTEESDLEGPIFRRVIFEFLSKTDLRMSGSAFMGWKVETAESA